MRNGMKEVVCSLSVLLLASVVPLAAAAAERPEGEPKALVDEAYAKIKVIAEEAPDQDALVERMTGALDKIIDYEGFAHRTLHKTWETLSESDKTRFMNSFKQLIIQTYAKRFKPKTKFTVEYRGDTVWTGEEKTLGRVKTTVKGKKVGADVDYYFRPSTYSGTLEWRTNDIEIDEVSMALNWRRQFLNIVKKKGFDALIEKIEKKVKPKQKAED